ncbi:MAG: hypothetical protein WA125_13100 [Desulfosporosinus sp.]
MRELIKKDDWEFNVDIDKTKGYYRAFTDLCDCDGCKNFYQTIRNCSAELTAFLEQFGIDIEKPIETERYIFDKQSKTVDYTAYYTVHGTVAKGSGYEIDFGSINVVVQSPKNSPNTKMPEPYFVFQIFNLFLPWVLTDDIESLDSPKEKRNIKQKQKLGTDPKIIFGKMSDMVPVDCKNYDHIENLVFSNLESMLDTSKLRKDGQNGYYIIDSVNDLWLEFGTSEVIIYYSKEHHHIMGMDFETMDEWASEVDRFLRLLINRTVRFENHFLGDKQIRVKLYSLHNGNEELIEHIRTTLNPLLLFSKNSRKEIKLIEFKQQ